MDNLYFGFRCEKTPDYQSFVSLPEAPRNYKKSEAIEGWKQQAISYLENEAAVLPFVGRVCEACVLRGDTSVKFLRSASSPLLPLITEHEICKSHFALEDPLTAFKYRSFGFGIRDAFQALAVESLRMSLSSAAHKLAFLWNSDLAPRFIYDPYEMIVPTSARKYVDKVGLCRYFNVMIFDRAVLAEDFNKPSHQAMIAQKLCRLLGIDR